MSFQTLDCTDFKIVSKIADHGFIQFYLAEDIKTRKSKLIIEYEPSDLNTSSGKRSPQNIVDSILKFDHPSFLMFYGYSLHNFQGEPSLMLFLHDSPHGTLDMFLEKERNSNPIPNFQSTNKYIVLLGISLGVKFSHSRGNPNCSLSANNIYLDDNFYPRMLILSSLQKKMQINEIDPIYIAPEVKNGQNHSYSSDAYSFSMIAYEIFTGKKPFLGSENRPEISYVKNEKVQLFLTKCWSEKPEERPSFCDIVEFLMQDEIKNYFNANDEEVLKYLSLFEDDLKSPNFFKAFDSSAPHNEGNADEMFIRGLILGEKEGKTDEMVKLLKKSADLGNIESMINYSIILNDGKEGVPIDKEESLRYLKLAAEQGNADAMYGYGTKFMLGDGVDLDMSKALHWFKLAAEKGNIYSIVNIASFYLQGKVVPQDFDVALKYYKMAAELGSAEGMNGYGNLLLITKKNIEEGIRYIKMAADHGSVGAMNNYATILLTEVGVEAKKREAAKYLRKAAKYGCTLSMSNYGQMLFKGDGIKRNRKKGLRYIQKAADLGNINAMELYVSCYVHSVTKNDKICEEKGSLFNKEDVVRYQKMITETGDPQAYLNYGNLFKFGWATPINKSKASHYIKLAADKGCSEAMYEYGTMCRDGDSVQTNKKEAAHYLKMAADNGHDLGMQNYAVMLYEGDGIPKDDKEALKYMKMAAEAGNANAIAMLNTHLKSE